MSRRSLIPSYKLGFARNAAQSERPNVRKGLVAAWLPSLGPTGLTLRDWGRGQNNHGTLANGPTWVSASRGGWELDFDGGSNNRVTATAASWFPGQSDMTISCWVRFDSVAAGKICWSWGNGNGYGGNDIELETPSGSAGVQFIWHLESNAVAIPLAAGVLGHIVCQRRGGTIEAWLDGVSAGTDTGVVDIAFNNHEFNLGGPTTNERHFDGQIGPVEIYNRALTPSEIADDFADPWAKWRPRQEVFPAAVAAPAGGGVNQILGGGILVA